MKTKYTFSFIKNSILLLSFALILTSFNIDTNQIVGVWKPKYIVYPKNFKNENDIKTLIDQTFQKSKSIYYHYHKDGTLTFESTEYASDVSKIKGTYTIKDKIITLGYNNSFEKTKILKLTASDLFVQIMEGSMKDFIFIYEKK